MTSENLGPELPRQPRGRDLNAPLRTLLSLAAIFRDAQCEAIEALGSPRHSGRRTSESEGDCGHTAFDSLRRDAPFANLV